MADDHDALLARADDNFHGHENRECGEHRTCGYRAWCLDCVEWCSPDAPCVRCEIPALRAAYLAALDVIGRLGEGWEPGPTFNPYGHIWRHDRTLDDEDEPEGPDPMSDREWRVYCDAAQRATHRSGT